MAEIEFVRVMPVCSDWACSLLFSPKVERGFGAALSEISCNFKELHGSAACNGFRHCKWSVALLGFPRKTVVPPDQLEMRFGRMPGWSSGCYFTKKSHKYTLPIILCYSDWGNVFGFFL